MLRGIKACRFINYETEDGALIIDIAIAEEYRQRGYGFDAAKALCDYLLSKKR